MSAAYPANSPATGLARALRGGIGIACLAAAGGLGLQHPLGGGLALVAVLLVAAVVAWRPGAWPVVLLATFPVAGLSPWTGWLGVEEFDLLVLACAAGAAFAAALRPVPPLAPGQARDGVPLAAVAGFLLYAVMVVVALWRGVDAAGGWPPGWFDGYHQPLASVRLAKPVLWLALLAPWWWAGYRQAPQAQLARLSLGMVLGLGLAAWVVLWERIAFTGLLDFSADYRATALFWEMHVGGATLDGYLALAVPFALRELATAHSGRRWALAAGVSVVALYACLITFSRGVYLMLVVGLACSALLVHLQRAGRRPGEHAPTAGGLRRMLLLAAGAGLAAAWLFPSSGYRGLLALFACLCLGVLLEAPLRALPWSRRWPAVLLGLAAGAALGVLAVWVPKGPYLAFALSFTTALLAWAGLAVARWRQPALLPLALAAASSTVVCLVGVAWHWGGHVALERAAPVALALLLGLVALPRPAAGTGGGAPPVPAGRGTTLAALRAQVLLLAVALAPVATVAVFGGGAYMEGRFSTGGKDFADRLQHWRQAVGFLLTPADLWLGKGLGRYPASHWLLSETGDNPGDHRWQAADGDGVLTLASGRHQLGFGELYRLSQRIEAPVGAVDATLRVRADAAAALHLEVCEKHLLYNRACLVRVIDLPARPGAWQDVSTRLVGDAPTRGAWYAPRQIVFSVAVSQRMKRVDVDAVALTDASGRALLANGDFRQGLARWFFSSDKFHMPWHAKNLLLHVLFDQGLVGLALWVMLVAAALWRTSFGSARRHPMAPAVATALVGFLVVGLFDSLVDSARLSFLWGAVVALGLVIGRGAGPPRPGAAHPA